MSARRFSALFAVISSFAALFMFMTSPVLAVINGTPDTTNQYPYVVLLSFETAGGETWGCSGTLISPTIVLTAGHCTANTVNAHVWQQADMRGSAEYPYGGPTAIDGQPLLIPTYGRRSFSNMMDVGLVILNRPIYLSQYGQIANSQLLSSLTRRQLEQTNFVIVGYGNMQMENKQAESAPTSHLRSSAIMHYAQSGTGATSAYSLGLVSTNGQGATCFGDSGGPVFYSDTNLIVGMVSGGRNMNCGGLDMVYRVDTDLAHNWVDAYLR